MRPVLVVIFFVCFRLGLATDILQEPMSCLIKWVRNECFTGVSTAIECISDINCEPDLDKACEDFAAAVSCSRTAAESEAECLLTRPSHKFAFQVWLRSIDALYNSICVDGLINDVSRRDRGTPCWDRANFEGCIFNELQMKHVTDLLNATHPVRNCLNLLVSSTSCGILSMRRREDCDSIADLPVHLVRKFFAETHCGRSGWVWNHADSSLSEVESSTIFRASPPVPSVNQQVEALSTSLIQDSEVPVSTSTMSSLHEKVSGVLYDGKTNTCVKLTVNFIYFAILFIGACVLGSP